MSISNGKKSKTIVIIVVAGIAIAVGLIYAWKTGLVGKIKNKLGIKSKTCTQSVPEVTPTGNAPSMPSVS